MPDLIFDTCVLSNFALSGSTGILRQLYNGRCFLTDHVYLEILRGIRSGRENLMSIQTATDDGWIRKILLQTRNERAIFERLTESLGSGEASCIAVAQCRSLVFACDDLAARSEAEKQGVLLTGTLGILRRACSRKILDVREADTILKKMIQCGFYSPVRSIGEIP